VAGVKSFFITSVGTEIGKTFVTCALVSQLRAQGEKAIALKPVISGFNDETAAETDTGLLLQAMGRGLNASEVEVISPFRFEAPLSPNMAAEKEGKTLELEPIIEYSQRTAIDQDYRLIEGVGGIMVPLNNQYTVLDWMKALGYPIMLVTGSYLGALSHTLTAIEVLINEGLTIQSLLVSQSEDGVSLDDTVQTLKQFTPDSLIIESIPRLANRDEPWKHVKNLTHILDAE
jgi:dethiobiotin synthetase